MRKIFLIIFIIFIPQYVSANVFTQTTIQNIDFQYVTYNINSTEYKLKVAISEIAIPLSQLAIENNAVTAINGIFFCPADYPQCKGKDYTINERFQNGEDLSFYNDTGERGVFGWDKNGVPLFHQTSKITPYGRANIYEGLGNFPILYSNGINMLEHYHDVGLYDIKMRLPKPRHFICSIKNKTQIIIGRTGAVSLDDLAPALYKLGCWDALNLDAGYSSHFLYNGKKIVAGRRNIIDGFVIERVGLDIKEIHKSLDIFVNRLKTQYRTIGTTETLTRLDGYLAYIPQLRTEIHDKYSTDIVDLDGLKIGYSIDITSLKDFRTVYVLNILETKIKDLKSYIISQN